MTRLMTARSVWASVMVAGVIVAAAYGSNAFQARAVAPPTSVAVVDLQEVFNNLREKTQLEADAASQADQVTQKLSDLKAKADQLEMDMEMFAPGSEEYKRKQGEYVELAIQFETTKAFHQRRSERESITLTQHLYQKIIDEVGTMAQERGLDLVMFKEPQFRFGGDKVQQLNMVIQNRKVLWSRDSLDLTEQIIQRMNNKFTNRVD